VSESNGKGAKLQARATELSEPDVANPESGGAHDAGDTVADPTSDDAVGTADDDGGDDGVRKRDRDRPQDSRSGEPQRISISVSTRVLVYGLLIAVLIGALGTVGWLYVDARQELDAQAHKSADYAHAEKLALDYAVNAATMNFQDVNGWKTKLVAGTSAELNDKLSKAAESMQQILLPLQWASTAQPLVAKVRSDTGGIYVVDCFVSVQTKTVQAPDPLQSTATYSLTLDSNKNWQITDVGGVGAVVGQK
jgi:Mce-associated membrane protein